MKTVAAMAFLVVTGSLFAQEPPAETEVLRSLRVIADETSPLSFRAQEVTRLLLDGDPVGLDGLRAILRSADSARETRLAVISGAIAHPDLALIEDVLSALLSADDLAFLADAEALFRLARLPALVKRLSAAAVDEATDIGQRLLAVRLLAKVATAEAAVTLTRLWALGAEPVSGRAREALFEILPVRFRTAAEADLYLEVRKGRDFESILREALLEAGKISEGGGGRRLVEFARELLGAASLDNLLVQYLACADLPEVRKMGAERLAVYPFAEREGAGEARGRSKALAAVLAGLVREKDSGVTVALLGAVKVLADTARAEAADPAFTRVSAALADLDPAVRLAAVGALRVLADRRSIEPLRDLYDRSAVTETELKIAILDALEGVGDGLATWIVAKIVASDPDELVAVRLVQLLKNYPEERTAVPTLVGLLKNGKASDKLRREAASTLGIVGVSTGVPEAIDVLAVFGLSDLDQSVRVIAATQLGRARGEVPVKVVEMLRARLGDVEPSPRVRLAAARSLLKLKGEEVVPEIAQRFTDEEFWKDAVRNYLKSDLIGAGQAARAAGFVRAICRAGMCDRCIEAARMVLEAKELAWTPETEPFRIEVAMDLARCLASSGNFEETRKVLRDEVPANGLRDDVVIERALLLSRASREMSDPAGGLAALQALKDTSPPEVQLETARCLLDLERFDDAEKALAPILSDEEVGKEALELLGDVKKARESAGVVDLAEAASRLVADLDDPDDAVKTVAARRLKDLGKEARPALLRWFLAKPETDRAAAVAVVAEISGLSLVYDPAAPEEERAAALDAIRQALR